MDAIYPGTFNLSKVKWGAKFDYEYVENYKVLQNAFDKNGIKKHIDVNNESLGDRDEIRVREILTHSINSN